MGLENKPAHVCEKLSLPQLPDKYWWKIKQNSFWDVPEVHLMWKGWFFSYSQNYYVGITLVHEKGYSAKEAAEIMAEHLWEDFQKEQNIANSTSELWAK